MVKAKRMMETDENGVERQFYPITHASAVRGLEKIIAGQSKVLSVNGYTGAVIITKSRSRLRKCTDRTSLCDRRNRRYYHC